MTCIIFSLLLFTAFISLHTNASLASEVKTSINSSNNPTNETKSISFILNNESIDLKITTISTNGNVEYNLTDGISSGTIYELKDNKILVSLYDQSNVVLIDLDKESTNPIFGTPDASQLESDNLYGVVWADILEVLPDKEHVVFYTTRSGDFKIYNYNINTGHMLEIPADKYKDIITWYDSTTAFIAEGLSDLSNEQYTLVKYNFETGKRTFIRTISSHHIQSLTFDEDNLGV